MQLGGYGASDCNVDVLKVENWIMDTDCRMIVPVNGFILLFA
jgi:hypothetical protein